MDNPNKKILREDSDHAIIRKKWEGTNLSSNIEKVRTGERNKNMYSSNKW